MIAKRWVCPSARGLVSIQNAMVSSSRPQPRPVRLDGVAFCPSRIESDFSILPGPSSRSSQPLATRFFPKTPVDNLWTS